MAKRKLTANQQAYRNQLKRIDKAVQKLAKQGYDTSKLPSFQMPKRVTRNALETIKSVTPSQLKTYISSVGTDNAPTYLSRRTAVGQLEQRQSAWVVPNPQPKSTATVIPFTTSSSTPTVPPISNISYDDFLDTYADENSYVDESDEYLAWKYEYLNSEPEWKSQGYDSEEQYNFYGNNASHQLNDDLQYEFYDKEGNLIGKSFGADEDSAVYTVDSGEMVGTVSDFVADASTNLVDFTGTAIENFYDSISGTYSLSETLTETLKELEQKMGETAFYRAFIEEGEANNIWTALGRAKATGNYREELLNYYARIINKMPISDAEKASLYESIDEQISAWDEEHQLVVEQRQERGRVNSEAMAETARLNTTRDREANEVIRKIKEWSRNR